MAVDLGLAIVISFFVGSTSAKLIVLRVGLCFLIFCFGGWLEVASRLVVPGGRVELVSGNEGEGMAAALTCGDTGCCGGGCKTFV